jgi:hypothetical protein
VSARADGPLDPEELVGDRRSCALGWRHLHVLLGRGRRHGYPRLHRGAPLSRPHHPLVVSRGDGEPVPAAVRHVDVGEGLPRPVRGERAVALAEGKPWPPKGRSNTGSRITASPPQRGHARACARRAPDSGDGSGPCTRADAHAADATVRAAPARVVGDKRAAIANVKAVPPVVTGSGGLSDSERDRA